MGVSMEEELSKALNKLVKRIQRQPVVPVEQQLWDEQQIADYFGYDLKYCKVNIMAHKNFPPSRDLPTSPDGKRVAPKWAAKDVIKYAMAFDKNGVTYR